MKHTHPASPVEAGARRQRLKRRNEAILAAYTAGRTLADIAVEHDLTRERVRQILEAQGIPRRSLREATRLRHDSMVETYGESILADYERLGSIGRTIAHYSDVVPAKIVRSVLSKHTLAPRIYPGRKQYTDDMVLRALRKADKAGASTMVSYARWRDTPAGKNSPSAPLVLLRFGSWNAAREHAGLDCLSPRKTVDSRQFSDEEIAEAVRRFAIECWDSGARPTANAYQQWADEAGDVPGLSTVRFRTSKSWTKVLSEVWGTR